MSLLSDFQHPGAGHLADNVLHFARVLRKAGLPLGTDRPLLALQALQVAGISSRADLHSVLQACLIDRVEHRALFDQAFQVFWRNPELLDQIMRLMLPATGTSSTHQTRGAGQRLMETHFRGATATQVHTEAARKQLDIEVHPSWSDRERLRKTDFDSMTTAEWAAAQRMVAALEPLLARIITRRHAPCARGARVDLRRLLRDSGRTGGDIWALPRRVRRRRTEDLTVIVDISGSMSRYSRMFLHFMHAIVNGSSSGGFRVSVFVFGTRLTNITRQLRSRDPDEAIAHVVAQVNDWSGGTRIGLSLKEFNQWWARRVPLATSTVLLVTDGLELAELELLSEEAKRLARSCRRVLWLNPLLRYEAFEPKARGIRAILPHVDDLLPVHNVESLEQLARALGGAASPESKRWK